MTLQSVSFRPTVTVALSDEELEYLVECSKKHYDSRCRAASDNGGFLNTVSRCQHNDFRRHDLTWADLDLLAKINEVGMYLSDPVKAELYVRLTLTLGLILKTARDLTPSPINYPT